MCVKIVKGYFVRLSGCTCKNFTSYCLPESTAATSSSASKCVEHSIEGPSETSLRSAGNKLLSPSVGRQLYGSRHSLAVQLLLCSSRCCCAWTLLQSSLKRLDLLGAELLQCCNNSCGWRRGSRAPDAAGRLACCRSGALQDMTAPANVWRGGPAPQLQQGRSCTAALTAARVPDCTAWQEQGVEAPTRCHTHARRREACHKLQSTLNLPRPTSGSPCIHRLMLHASICSVGSRQPVMHGSSASATF